MVATVVATGVTTAGTAWTHYSEPVGLVDVAHWSVGDVAATDGTLLRPVLYCGGSGHEPDQFAAAAKTYWKPTFETIIDNGGIVAEGYGTNASSSYNGKYGWFRPFVKPGYKAIMQAIDDRYPLKPVGWVVIGRSMGGGAGKQIVADPAPHTIAGYIDCSGIYDLMAEYDRAPSPPGYFNIPSYWGTPSADRAALLTATDGYDPGRFAPSVWAGRKVLVVYGTADTTAIPEIAGLGFWDDIQPAGLNSLSKLVPVPGATHKTTGGTYGHASMGQFMVDVWGIVPPPPDPGQIYRVISNGRVGDNRQQFPLSPHLAGA